MRLYPRRCKYLYQGDARASRPLHDDDEGSSKGGDVNDIGAGPAFIGAQVI
jgi:hypothetical protein